jgi:hypothetical protein
MPLALFGMRLSLIPNSATYIHTPTRT